MYGCVGVGVGVGVLYGSASSFWRAMSLSICVRLPRYGLAHSMFCLLAVVAAAAFAAAVVFVVAVAAAVFVDGGGNAVCACSQRSRYAASSLLTTNAAAAAAMTTWLVLDKIVKGHVSAVGACVGTVAGLVGVTPMAGFISVTSSVVVGTVTCLGCYITVELKNRWGSSAASAVVAAASASGGAVVVCWCWSVTFLL